MAEFEAELNKNKAPRPTVLVCGWNGTGKSSLINTMLNVDAPISDGTPCTQQFDVYENDLIRVYDSKGMEKGEAVPEFVRKLDGFIKERRTLYDMERNIHIVWYTVAANTGRFEDGDEQIVNELSKLLGKRNIVFVLTKCDSARENQIAEITKLIKERCEVTDRDIIQVCDEEGMHDERTPKEIKEGVRKLLTHSMYILPDAYHDAMILAQKVDIEMKLELIRNKKAKANAIITGATASAAAAAVVPIPVANTVAITGIQMAMVASLAGLFTIGIPKEAIMPFIASVVGRQAAASLLSVIPGLGSLINAGVAGSITGGIGMYCSAVFEKAAIAKAKGEKLPNIVFDTKTVLDYIKNYKKLE
ncbi:MAG: 50S ribosome-binding GTPase [Treponema sp.]|nr:50S ribosome-binding GTPase [Treponema sp.]